MNLIKLLIRQQFVIVQKIILLMLLPDNQLNTYLIIMKLTMMKKIKVKEKILELKLLKEVLVMLWVCLQRWEVQLKKDL